MQQGICYENVDTKVKNKFAVGQCYHSYRNVQYTKL